MEIPCKKKIDIFFGFPYSGKNMSYLSSELAAVAKKNSIRQIDVTKQVGLSVAHVSRIFTGEQVFATTEDLDKIIAVVAKSKQDRGRIIRARMLDAYHGKDADLVKITLQGGAPPPDRLSTKVAVDPDVKAAFDFLLRLVPSNPAVGLSIVQLARMMGMPE